MLGEAHWCDTIDAYSQDSDEQVDNGDPVCKKRPRGDSVYEFNPFLSKRTHIIGPVSEEVPYLWSSMSSICRLT